MTNKYIINAKRWFDKVNGNTYHSIQITEIKTHKIIFESDNINYGYGDQYRNTAISKLIELKKINKETKYNHDLNRKRFFWNVSEVNKERDLLEWSY